MVVLVCGDRDWTNGVLIWQFLEMLPKDTVIVHGAARGADTLAGFAAKDLELTTIPVPADWHKFGRAAGVIRNRTMLREYRPVLIIAFHNDIDYSRGTKDMVELGKRAKIETLTITEMNSEGYLTTLRNRSFATIEPELHPEKPSTRSKE
jgi:hypothetical protein